jgi:hypothetical protein
VAGAGDFPLIYSVQAGSGAQPSCRVGSGSSLPGGKGPGREGDHSPVSSAEVKNGGATSIYPHPHLLSWHSA